MKRTTQARSIRRVDTKHLPFISPATELRRHRVFFFQKRRSNTDTDRIRFRFI